MTAVLHFCSRRTEPERKHSAAGCSCHPVVVVAGRSSSLCHVPQRQARPGQDSDAWLAVARTRGGEERLPYRGCKPRGEARRGSRGLTPGVESCRMRTAGGQKEERRVQRQYIGSKVAYIARIAYFALSCRCRYPKPHGEPSKLPTSGGRRGKGRVIWS
jgi:hypothetical protein